MTKGRAREIAATSSWTTLAIASLVVSLPAAAQTVPPAVPAQTTDSAPETSAAPDADAGRGDDILVVGSRESQQSANRRKKDARTATDSLVADDIGSFPDRNVNEAISRIPGVALERNEFGEGSGVAVRGNGPDLTRVELDGVGVGATNNLAIDGTGSRGADLRELPAEIIKSVDVVKGSTADQTEGSLGGGIQIKTRSGLDFKKPYYSFRVGAQQNSLGKDWTPDGAAVASRKFLDDRLGVIVSGTYSKLQNNGHSFENTTSNNRGYSRLYDFDNSPQKTFGYNISTIGADAADVPFANSLAPDGTTLTPRELVTLSAGAQSKAECLTIFPNNPNGSNAQKAQRILEQQSCLNQWNDYTPSLIRNLTATQLDERYSVDARFDFRINDKLVIYAKGTRADRKVEDTFRTRTPISLFNANPAGTFVDTTTGYPRMRSVSPTAPAGYNLFDPQYGLNAVTVSNNTFATLGNVLNVIPGSVVVDGNHNVTEMTLTNNSVTIDQIDNRISTETGFIQAGAEWRDERFEIDLWGGMTRAETSRGDQRTARSYQYGDATIKVQPNGLWDIQLPSNYDDGNAANFVQLNRPPCVSGGTNPATCVGQNAVAASPTGPATPAYLVSQLPSVTPSFNIQYTPRLGISQEKIAKFDLAYRTFDQLPFVTRIKVGGMYRANRISRWSSGGYTAVPQVGTFGQPGYVPAVIVPTAIVRGTYRACEPTATSTVSCNYGFVPSTNPANVRSGVDTLTPDQLRALFASTLEEPDSQYFGDLPNRGSLPASWIGIETGALAQQLGAYQFFNADCLITCVGSDGKTYAQPVTRTNETIKNVYAMFDFAQEGLPLGIEIDGNAGVRGVFTSVKGSGLQTLQVIRVTSSYDPANPNAAAGITTTSFAAPATINSSTTDWLPSLNFNIWGFDRKVVLRLYSGKTISRPPVDRLIPAGTCNAYDERQTLDPGEDEFGCPSGRVGNPALKPFTAWNYNASVEWYPNADTLLSATYGRLDVKIGAPINVTATGRPFATSELTDPVTGRPLSEFEFTYPTYANGPGYQRDILEFQAKTAFTWAPWFLRHTGADVNLSILSSSTTTGQQDPLSGDVMLPPDESKYYFNASLWYDDGKFNARVAYQKRSARFNCITPCGGNTVDINYPGEQWTNVRLVAPGYNPGVPRFTDGSTFIDAKASYNISREFQVYVEGRNIAREAQTISTGGYTDFADGTPKIMRLQYGGRRILFGARMQFGR